VTSRGFVHLAFDELRRTIDAAAASALEPADEPVEVASPFGFGRALARVLDRP
jgi:hypothetical protein